MLRKLKKKYPAENIKKYYEYRAVKRFEETGSVTDSRHRNSGRPKSIRNATNIAEVRQVIGETSQISLRKVLGNIANQASRTRVHRMLRFEIKLTPYTISVMQHFKDSDIESRLHFAHDQIADVIWFSDEAHFHLNAQVNKRNCWFWGSEKPDLFLEKPLHGKTATAWTAVSSAGIIGPFFFEDESGDIATVNSDHYLRLLRNKFLPAL